MSDHELVTLATYPDEGSAAIAQSVLSAAGIPAHTVDGATTTTLSHVGTALGGVRLQVPSVHADQAARLLDQSQSNDQNTLPQQPWTCPRCGANVDAGFGVCWSCMAQAPESTFTTPSAPRAKAPSPADADESAALSADDAVAPKSADVLADRAWRAALIGVVIPFVLPYAAVLILRLVPHDDLSPPASRKFYGALAVVFLMCCAWWALFSPM